MERCAFWQFRLWQSRRLIKQNRRISIALMSWNVPESHRNKCWNSPKCCWSPSKRFAKSHREGCWRSLPI
jgi:hypothetical protein